MNTSVGVNTSFGILHRNCDYNLPMDVCLAGNISGVISMITWFLVLLPQVVHNFRRRSVDGLSLPWAIMNFTSAMNHAFFVFKWGTLPLDDQIMAVYMTILEFVILVEFWMFTERSKRKWIVLAFCCAIWLTIVFLQAFLAVYDWMEWISVTLWSVQTFPQVFLNFKRRSTRGLALGMVLLTTIGKSTDFWSTYLLIMPIQFVVMCYFSSTIAFAETVQVVFYWNRKPVRGENKETVEKQTENIPLDKTVASVDVETEKNQELEPRRPAISKTCNVFRFVSASYCIVMFAIFVTGLQIRCKIFLSYVSPVATFVVIFASYFYYYHFKDRKQCTR